MCKLTVVIPIYNVEQYIEKCLESVCEQYIDGIQVVCIDDCSTDNSYMVISSLLEKYPFLEIYQNETNLGLAATRNLGLKKSKGKYIMFVDSDDYVANNAINILVNRFEQETVDVLFYSTQMFWDVGFVNEANLDRRIRKQEYSLNTGIGLMCDFIRNDEMFGAAWGAIYRKEYLLDNNIKFIEGILHEDIPFVFNVLLNATKADCINEIIYFYRQRNNSILNSPDYNKLIEGLVIGYMNMINCYYEYSIKNNYDTLLDNEVKKYLDTQLFLIEDRYEKLIVTGKVISNSAIDYLVGKLHNAKDLDTCFDDDDISFIKNSERLVLYGAGCIATRIMKILKTKKIQVDKIYVTSKENNPEEFFGIKVYEFNPKMVIDNDEALIVGISIDNSAELIEGIKASGISKFIRTIAR